MWNIPTEERLNQIPRLYETGIEVDCKLECHWTIKQAREIKQIKIYEG